MGANVDGSIRAEVCACGMFEEGSQRVMSGRAWLDAKLGYISVGNVGGGGMVHSSGRSGAEQARKGGSLYKPCWAGKKAHYGSLDNWLRNEIMVRNKKKVEQPGERAAFLRLSCQLQACSWTIAESLVA